MFNLLTILSTIPLFSTTPKTINQPYISSLMNNQIVVESNNDDWNDYYEYLLKNGNSLALEYNNNNQNDNNNKYSVSDEIVGVNRYLKSRYSDYNWIKDDSRSSLTSDVSNHIPIEMQLDYYKKEEIYAAIKAASVENDTSYGGCGPIASLGILDYFARYLGYTEIINDPNDSNQRIKLATDILSRTHFSIFGSEDKTLVWPWDNINAFNSYLESKGLDSIISAYGAWDLYEGHKDDYLSLIKYKIDEGLPVTLCTGKVPGNGEFKEHYTNVYGYETWVGIPYNGGNRIEKTFLKARINKKYSEEYYCDSDILDQGQIGVIVYNINYSSSYNFYAKDFSKAFVNSNGGGQYFFKEKINDVLLPNGINLSTKRLRTSFIEDKYLVLSPNRLNAGEAYLDITFPHSIARLSFDTAMWSNLEGQLYENFIIQYMDPADSSWKDHRKISLTDLTTLKDYPQNYKMLFPRNTKRIRFLAKYDNPDIERNKGRIILENFNVSYN